MFRVGLPAITLYYYYYYQALFMVGNCCTEAAHLTENFYYGLRLL